MRANNNRTGHYSSFVLKIWVDEGNDEGFIRGQIQHVDTRESMHFLDLDKMTAFIMSHLYSQSRNSTVVGGEGTGKISGHSA